MISSTGRKQKESPSIQENISEYSFKNIKLSSRKRQYKGASGLSNMEYEEFGGKCRFAEKSRGMNRKEKVCDKVSSLARNNEDAKQFVMPSSAILTTQILNMELMNVENKVSQLNCCKKDLDLLKNKFRESQHKRKRGASQIMNKGFQEN
ncbi:unnamed protein product [Moneuplotes crassus]|uniref:Uncharacterized protein n=1 Tax=Euplotes crassus TaxID=5936 RepID=A0AAD1UBG7_EUPCR|nr:unnamed protein product [Moneuplotes crassus]